MNREASYDCLLQKPSCIHTSSHSPRQVPTSRGDGVAPSGHHAALIWNGASAGQGHSLDIAVECSRATQLDEHDVIVQCESVEVGVLDDLGRVDELFGALLGGEAVLTKAHLDATSEGSEQLGLVMS